MSTEYKSTAKLDVSDVKRGAKEAADSVNKIIQAINGVTNGIAQMTAGIARLEQGLSEISAKMGNFGKAADKATGKVKKTKSETEKLKEEFANFEVTIQDENLVEMRKELEELQKEQAAFKLAGIGFGYEKYDRNAVRIREIMQATKDYEKELYKASDAARYANLAPDSNSITSRWKQAKENLKSMEKAGLGLNDASYNKQYQEFIQLSEAKKALEKSLSSSAIKDLTPDITVSNQEIADMTQRLRDLESEKKLLEKAGYGPGFVDYEQTIREIDRIKTKQREYMAEITKPATINVSVPDNLFSQLEQAKQNVKSLESAGFGPGNANYDQQYREMLRLTQEVRDYKKSLMDTEPEEKTASKLSQLGSIGKKALSGVSGLISRLKKGISGLGSGTGKAGNNVGNAFKTMLKYTVGIRSLYILVNKLRSALVTGFGNLAKESNQTNYALSTLKSSLTMLQNSFAAAFSPLVNTVAPILASFIQTIADAISYVGAFFATLTGQSSYTRAVYNYQSIADSAGSAASGTDAANKAAEEYQKTLAGFDEITKLNDPSGGNASGGSGNSGNGNSGGGISFETVSIPNAVSDWAEKFKEAWEKADFTEFGTIVGTKLKNALDNIDWMGIQEKCEKIAKSVATFLNGFFETEDLGTSIGKTIGDAFNTKLDFENTFMEAFHFDSLGSFITSGIQAALDEVDFSQITRKISNQIISIADFLQGCIEGVNWQGVPQGIWDALVEAFNGIKWSDIASSISGLAGAAAGAVAGILSGIAQAITDNYTKLTENGENILAGILQGIGNALINIPQWAKDNILVPFIDGFKAAFGIHSPASAPELLSAAGYVGEGILNGILQPFKNIGAWVKDNILTPLISAFEGASSINFDSLAASLELAVLKGIRSAASRIEDILNSAISVLNLVPGIDIPEIKLTGKLDEMIDDLTEKQKTVSGVTTIFDKAKDDLSGADKTISTISKYTTATDALSAGEKTIKNMTAGLTRKDTGSLDKTISGMTANLSRKNESFNKTTSAMTANLSGKSEKFSKTTSGMTAAFTKKSTTGLNKNIGSMTAVFTKKSDSLPSSKKRISGITAVVTAIKAGTRKISSWLGIKKAAMGGMYRNGHWSPIQAYASGGLPNQGQMFIAREAGPELVGSIGSGTAVMNNDQIVASVSAGVYKAVLAAMSGNRSGGNQNLTVQVILDSKVAGEAFVNYLKGQAAQGNFPLAGLT